MLVHDLKSRAHWSLGEAIFFLPGSSRRSCARRSICVFATHAFSAASRVQHLRRALQRPTTSPRLYVSRSILVLGVRATYVSGKPARHRDVPAGARAEIVSCRF